MTSIRVASSITARVRMNAGSIVVVGSVDPAAIADAVSDYLTANPPSGLPEPIGADGTAIIARSGAAVWDAIEISDVVGLQDALDGDVVGPSSATDGRPALFDGTTGKLLKVGAVNAPDGLARLNGSGVLPDTVIDSTIARDSEVTAAISSAIGAIPADGSAATASLRTLGTGATQAAAGNDSRLSDARTPTAHNHAASEITSGTIDIARIPTGTSSTTVAVGNDSRLSDARTPTDGSVTDAKIATTLSQSTITNLTTDLAGKVPTSRTVNGKALSSDITLTAADVGAQASDSELSALAGLTSAADKLPYFTGSGTAALTTLTSFARTLLDDADAATARTTLGVGTGSVATDAIFDAKGDLAVGTGADTAAKLAVGASGNVPMADASASTGLVYGVVPGQTLARPYVSGKYYAAPRSTSGTTSFAADFVRYVPYVPHARVSMDRIIIYTNLTASGEARLGIYDATGTNGMPGARIVDAGTVATTGATGERLITISQSLQPGTLYWLAVIFNVSHTAAHTTRGPYSEPQWGEESATSGPLFFATESRSYGALPATATPVASGASQPTIWLRAA